MTPFARSAISLTMLTLAGSAFAAGAGDQTVPGASRSLTTFIHQRRAAPVPMPARHPECTG